MDDLLKKITEHPLVKKASGWERILIITIAIVATPGGLGLITNAIADVADKLTQQEKIVERLVNIEAEKAATTMEFSSIKNSVKRAESEQMILGVKINALSKQFDEYRKDQRQFQIEMRQWMMK